MVIEQALYGGQDAGGYRFLARSPGFGDDWLKFGGIKIFYDGGMTLRTAMMRDVYPDSHDNYCGIA